MSRDVAATERKRAQSNRFHQRAERLLARTARAHPWFSSPRDSSCQRSPPMRADHVTSASIATGTGRRASARSTSTEGACPSDHRCINPSSSVRRGWICARRRTRTQRFRMMRMTRATSSAPCVMATMSRN